MTCLPDLVRQQSASMDMICTMCVRTRRPCHLQFKKSIALRVGPLPMGGESQKLKLDHNYKKLQ